MAIQNSSRNPDPGKRAPQTKAKNGQKKPSAAPVP
jgi:hypothetical protein